MPVTEEVAYNKLEGVREGGLEASLRGTTKTPAKNTSTRAKLLTVVQRHARYAPLQRFFFCCESI